MKYNQVTWYSKLLAMVLFVTLPFIGFYLGMKYQEGLNPPTTTVVELSNGSSTKTVVNTDQITVKTTYDSGILKYSGTVQLPAPCYTLQDDTKVLESFPEQVQIRLSILPPPPNAGICIQTLTNKEFSGEVQVSKDATVSVYLNNKEIE